MIRTFLLRRLRMLRRIPAVLFSISILLGSIFAPFLSHPPTQPSDTARQFIAQFEGFEVVAIQLKKGDNGPEPCGPLVIIHSEISDKGNVLFANARPCIGVAVPFSARLVYTQTVSGYL